MPLIGHRTNPSPPPFRLPFSMPFAALPSRSFPTI